MPEASAPASAPGGRFALNVMQFCRALRAAGLPVGPGKVLAALEAVEAVGIERRDDFYWALHAALVNRRDQREIFDQAFHLFWRNPELLKRAMAMLLPQMSVDSGEDKSDVSRRVAEALQRERKPGEGESPDGEDPEMEVDARLTWSDKEVLRQRDFEQMTAAEIAEAKRLIAEMALPLDALRTRRFETHPAGPRVDLRRTLRQSLRGGGAVIDLARKRHRVRTPPLVVLCDISGSMSHYSRMLLHFLHAVTTDRDRVYSFVFGTRLTNITRYLRHRDVDVALQKVGQVADDWSGGTRIARCLHDFNQWWSRRVLAQGAVVLLITDGLERDEPEALREAMDRLHRSCRRLVWLNPLLRYERYAPKSQGARVMMPHVDAFLPVHNLASLTDLVEALSKDPVGERANITRWRSLASAA